MDDAELKELLKSVKGGDERSFEELAARYRPMLTSVAASFDTTAKENGIYGIFQDLYQELTLSLFRAAKSFDTEQNKVTFGCYAKRCAGNCAVSVLRRHRSQKRREEKIKSRLKKEQKSSSFFSESTDSDRASVLSKLGEIFSPYEYDVISRYLDGMSVADIARDTGRSAKSVSNAVFRCKAKVRELYGRE